jgi:putative methionine-R-sulfoxide reductase with GAF domain
VLGRARVAVVDWATVLDGIDAALASDQGRAEKAVRVAALIRRAGAFSSTRSEAIVPVVDPATGAVVGTLDVESAERNAFTDADQQALERCAAALRGLFAEVGS